MSLMISMAKVTSKLFITKNQILSFFQSYGFTTEDFHHLFDRLENHNSSEKLTSSTSSKTKTNYSLKAFTKYVQESHKFLEYIRIIKDDILNFALPRIIYNTINKRIKFYYENGINKVIPPKESCASSLIRILITNAPRPYHYDYCLENEQLAGGFDKAVMVIKHIFDENNNSSLSSIHRRKTASCRSHRHISTGSKSSRMKTELSINSNMKSSKIVPFCARPLSP